MCVSEQALVGQERREEERRGEERRGEAKRRVTLNYLI